MIVSFQIILHFTLCSSQTQFSAMFTRTQLTTINSEYSNTKQSVPLFPLELSGCLPKLKMKIDYNLRQDDWQKSARIKRKKLKTVIREFVHVHVYIKKKNMQQLHNGIQLQPLRFLSKCSACIRLPYLFCTTKAVVFVISITNSLFAL